jgi:hypothetical protein
VRPSTVTSGRATWLAAGCRRQDPFDHRYDWCLIPGRDSARSFVYPGTLPFRTLTAILIVPNPSHVTLRVLTCAAHPKVWALITVQFHRGHTPAHHRSRKISVEKCDYSCVEGITEGYDSVSGNYLNRKANNCEMSRFSLTHLQPYSCRRRKFSRVDLLIASRDTLIVHELHV